LPKITQLDNCQDEDGPPSSFGWVGISPIPP
jgi:hypothetical protein